MKTFIRQLLAVAAFTAILSAAAQTATTDIDAEALVRQLGSTEFQEREAASATLEKLGYRARTAVRKAIASDDPEVRARTRKLWKKLRWAVVDDTDGNVASLLKNIRRRKVTVDAWEQVIMQHGAPMVEFVLELRQERNLIVASQLGMITLLDWLDTMAIERELMPRVSDRPHEMLSLMDSLPTRNGSVTVAVNRLRLYALLGAVDRVERYGPDLWHHWQSEMIINEVAYCMMHATPQTDLWPAAGTNLYYQDDVEALCDTLYFYIVLGHKLKSPGIITHLIDIAAPDGAHPASLEPIAEFLSNNHYTKALATLIEDTGDAPLLYLQAVAGDDDDRQAFWSTIDKVADEEIECLRLAALLDGRDNSRMINMLERVLALKPDNTVYDTRAAYSLAHYYVTIADYGRAAGYYERIEGSEHVQRAIAGITLANLKDLIKDLRERPVNAEYSRLIASATDARERQDYTAVISACREAIALQPKAEPAYMMLFDACKSAYLIDELRAVGQQAITVTPNDSNGNLRATSITCDIMEFEKSLTFANEAIRQAPEAPQCYLSRAFTLERLGRYDDAVKDFEHVLKMSTHYGQCYEGLGLVLAQKGDYRQAARNFEKAMHYDGDPDYLLLWMYLCYRRTGFDSSGWVRDYRECRQLGDDKWIGSLFAACLGEIKSEELLAAARKAPTPAIAAGQLCEAYFVLGQLHLANGKPAAARAAFKAAVATNITVFVEYIWALAELARPQ